MKQYAVSVIISEINESNFELKFPKTFDSTIKEWARKLKMVVDNVKCKSGALYNGKQSQKKFILAME